MLCFSEAKNNKMIFKQRCSYYEKVLPYYVFLTDFSISHYLSLLVPSVFKEVEFG